MRRNPSAEAQLARVMEDRKQRKERRRALRDQQPDSQAGFHSDGGSDDDGRGDGKGLVAGRAAGKGMARVARHIDKKKFKAAKVWTMMDALSRRVAGVAGGAPKADEAVVKLDVGEVADGRGLCVRRGTDGGFVCAGEQMGVAYQGLWLAYADSIDLPADTAAGLSYEWETGKPYSWLVPPPPPEPARSARMSQPPTTTLSGEQRGVRGSVALDKVTGSAYYQ